MTDAQKQGDFRQRLSDALKGHYSYTFEEIEQDVAAALSKIERLEAENKKNFEAMVSNGILGGKLYDIIIRLEGRLEKIRKLCKTQPTNVNIESVPKYAILSILSTKEAKDE